MDDNGLPDLIVTDHEFLAQGSEGKVYLGKWNGHLVAVKKSNTERCKEVELMRNLQHTNVIQLLDSGTWRSKPAIIMEYCAGGCLTKAIRSERMTNWNLWIKCVREIVDGMMYLHENRVIHRDLKPENILLTKDDDIRISDFGMSREKLMSKSTFGTVAGTCCYMAPEMIKNEKYTKKVDVWSFGVVLWTMLSGQEPYNELSQTQIIYNVGASKVRLLIPLVTPIKISALIKCCWRKMHPDRPDFPDIQKIIDDIVENVDSTETEWAECVRRCHEETSTLTYAEVAEPPKQPQSVTRPSWYSLGPDEDHQLLLSPHSNRFI